MLQFSITALRDVRVTLAFELMHGLHYGSYLEDIRDEIFDVKLFMPNRTSSSTDEFLTRRENAEYSSFVSIITKEIFDDLEMRLPMNLPMELKRKRYKVDEFESTFAHDILIDRIGNLSLGDRDYAVRQQDPRYIAETYVVFFFSVCGISQLLFIYSLTHSLTQSHYMDTLITHYDQ